MAFDLFTGIPQKFRQVIQKEQEEIRGFRTKFLSFLVHEVLKTALQEDILVKPRTLSRTYQRGKKTPHDFPSVVSNDFLRQNRVLQNTQKPVRKKKMISIGCSGY